MPDYDADFYGWANEQAALLRSGKLADADVANIAEEIESMGRSEKRELVNRLAVLLEHLLKWHAQPNLRSTSWRLTVEEQRIQLRSHLADNPSLKPILPDAITQDYRLGLLAAQRDTGLAAQAFPPSNPWTEQQILDDGFHPE